MFLIFCRLYLRIPHFTNEQPGCVGCLGLLEIHHVEQNCSKISKPPWEFSLPTGLALGVYWSCTLILALTSAILFLLSWWQLYAPTGPFMCMLERGWWVGRAKSQVSTRKRYSIWAACLDAFKSHGWEKGLAQAGICDMEIMGLVMAQVNHL